jgi:translocation and assembly module TamB
MSPGHVFARGRGLDSEWKGELRVSGGADEPAITGKLSLVRGRVNFLGKRFTLKRGSIVFDGLAPRSAKLDVLAEASAKDMTAWLQLSGTVAAPKVDLSSEPSLPSDEILSRLLFGRSITNITPVQAIRLAQAVNVMARGDGFDFLERTRRLLGIDQLEVKQAGDDPREATLSAGKYVTEKVYLEVERGIGAQSGKATVELELTPNISVETEVGANSEGGVGLNWKWDY